jgi:prephenate dehydrogenase
VIEAWRVALIGCGHIGGSLALALRAASRSTHVIGYDKSTVAAERALMLGLVDALAPSAAAAAAGADVVVLAVPIAAMPGVVVEVAATLAPDALVMDVGSLKADIVRAADAALAAAGKRGRFVGAHPMAGTASAGPDAAMAALFRGRAAFLTPTADTAPDALARAKEIWHAAGARVVELDPVAHDRAVAALSHLPHVIAYALAGSLGADARLLTGLAGPSFADVTRVADSAPATWASILHENRAAILPWIERLEARLAAITDALRRGDTVTLERLLAEGQTARREVVK